jgi:KUP system potassium uptake protein
MIDDTPALGSAWSRADRAPAGEAAKSRTGHHGPLAPLALTALGVVFGDIGTSPLYALKECVTGEHGVPPTRENLLGILSLMFWSLVMVVTVKYLTFVMRADNHGEGGIVALLALVPQRYRERPSGSIGLVAALVLFGAALLYGDGMITPAISVLSAIEGLEVATPRLEPFVVPITCLVLLGLFALERRGTSTVGKLFGPVMVLWFGAIAVLGAAQLVQRPGVLVAVGPWHAARFFARHGEHGVLVLGAVVLTVTGGEALYADMGHFGRRPIQIAWYGLVLPSLLLNYFGQGALLLADPTAVAHPFYSLAPAGIVTYLLIVLATAATVIASQALISGAFSLTQQAVQLGFLPRFTIRHTSRLTEGQIYIPEVNWLLAFSCIVLVLAFGSSSRLAAAYGIAVTGTMGITSIAYYIVTRRTWGWPRARAVPLLLLFLSFDLPFLFANLFKLMDGGYVPVLVAGALFGVMLVWRRGRQLLGNALRGIGEPIEHFLSTVDERVHCRVPGTAVFLTSSPASTPATLLHHVRRNKVLHETVLLLKVVTEHVPRVPPDEALEIEPLPTGFFRVQLHTGFMQSPSVPDVLRRHRERFCAACIGGPRDVDFDDVTYYLGRETLLATGAGRMSSFVEGLFAFLSRNAASATAYFGVPPERVVELGIQLDL